MQLPALRVHCPTIKEIVWLAGLLEGEGSFFCVRGKYPRITVEMNDLDVIERVATLLGKGTAQPRWRKGYKRPTYLAYCDGVSARGWMMTLYQFMGERRQAKIHECLTIWHALGGSSELLQQLKESL